MSDEVLKVSEEYLKAYNQADMICTHMPQVIDGMKWPENDQSEYNKGFRDRMRQYEIERDAARNFSVDQLKEKYGKDLDDYGKDRAIDRDKD